MNKPFFFVTNMHFVYSVSLCNANVTENSSVSQFIFFTYGVLGFAIQQE